MATRCENLCIFRGTVTSWQIDGETVETVTDFNFWGSKITADGANKVSCSQGYGFSSSQVWMWELDPRKDPDAGKDWRQEEKGTTEDEVVGWHHWLDGNELEQAPGVGEGQGSLVCCKPWGLKESDTTKQLNWTELKNLECLESSVNAGIVLSCCLSAQYSLGCQ